VTLYLLRSRSFVVNKRQHLDEMVYTVCLGSGDHNVHVARLIDTAADDVTDPPTEHPEVIGDGEVGNLVLHFYLVS
jgi:hypothetical protein